MSQIMMSSNHAAAVFAALCRAKNALLTNDLPSSPALMTEIDEAQALLQQCEQVPNYFAKLRE